MRILFVSEFFWPRPAGGEVWAFELCQALAKKHDVTVLTTRHDDSPAEETKDGIRILRPVRAGRNRLSRKLATQRLVRAVAHRLGRERPDVIHVTAYTMNVPVSRLAKRHGIRCVTAVHAYFGDAWRVISPAWRLLRRLERQALRDDASAVMHVPSKHTQARILEETGVRTEVLPNWLPERFPKPKRLLPGTCVFVGSLEPIKDPLACIPAAKRLIVIGKGSLERRMRDAARKAGIECAFIGRCTREQALAYIGGASLVLVPSVSESFSLVALEAVAQGTPVSGNPVGILPELPGVIPFPPRSMPPRLPNAKVAAVRARFSRDKAVRQVVKWYRKSG